MPQNLITEPDAALPDGEELPALTAQQQKFVEGIVSGKTASDAYRAAYDCSNSQASTVWAEASRLRNDNKVSAWIAAAQKACLGAATLTLEQHSRQLERLREIALEKGNIGAAVNAEVSRGKAQGLYVEQIRDVTEHDPMRTLMEIAAVDRPLAEQLAKQHNIPFPQATEHTDTRH